MAYYEDFSTTGDGFISVEDNGQWFPGNSYTVTYIKEYRRKTNYLIDPQFDQIYYVEETCRDLAPVNLYESMRLGSNPHDEYGVFKALHSSDYVVDEADNGLIYSPLRMTGYTYPDPREESINDISWLVAPGITCTSAVYSSAELEGANQPDNVHRKKEARATFSIASSVAPGIYHMAVKTWRGRAAAFIAGPFPGSIEEISHTPKWVETNEERISISIGFTNGTGPNIFPPPRTGIDHDNDFWNPPEDDGGGEGDGDGGGDGGVGDWTGSPADLRTLGGGRYGQQIVVVGNKKIYFGGIS